jgi:8-oxo-dGTP diphosphatase
MMMRVKVAIAIIINNENKILIARRPEGKPHPGLWEFPGGKIEQGETVEDALKREVYEEVHLKVETAELFKQVQHDYKEELVFLNFMRVTKFTGDAIGKENQPIRWIKLQDLAKYTFPKASDVVIEQLLTTLS